MKEFLTKMEYDYFKSFLKHMKEHCINYSSKVQEWQLKG